MTIIIIYYLYEFQQYEFYCSKKTFYNTALNFSVLICGQQQKMQPKANYLLHTEK